MQAAFVVVNFVKDGRDSLPAISTDQTPRVIEINF